MKIKEKDKKILVVLGCILLVLILIKFAIFAIQGQDVMDKEVEVTFPDKNTGESNAPTLEPEMFVPEFNFLSPFIMIAMMGIALVIVYRLFIGRRYGGYM